MAEAIRTRAIRSMSRPAVQAADEKFYQQHPEMVINGRRMPIDPHDPKQARLRREWMALYEANGGQVERVPPKAVADQVRRADTEADRAPCTGPTSATVACPDRRPQPLAVEKVVAAPKPEKPPVPCKLLQATVTCEHGRQPSTDGLLMVASEQYADLGDKITCRATSVGGCGEHVEWSIAGYWTSRERGTQTTFHAKPFKPSLNLPLINGWLGLHRIEPHVYRVQVSACEGGAPLVEVRSYPPDKWSGKFDFEGLRKAIKNALRFAPIDEEKKRELEAGWCVGSVEFSQQWKEDKKSALAFCESAISGGFDPLFKFDLPPLPIYPGNLVPPALQKWLKAGLYVKFGGGALLKIDLLWQYWPDSTEDTFDKWTVTAGGNADLKLSINLFMVSEDLVSAEVAGSTGLTLAGKFIRTKPVGIGLFLTWQGLEGSFTLTAGWGIIEYRRTYPILKEREAKWGFNLDDTADQGD